MVDARPVAEHRPQEALVAELGEVGGEPGRVGVIAERQVHLECHPRPQEVSSSTGP